MGRKLTHAEYAEDVKRDLAWLQARPIGPEREHIISIVMESSNLRLIEDNVAKFYEDLIGQQQFELAAKLKNVLGFIPQRAT